MNITEWVESSIFPFKNRDSLAEHLNITRQQWYNIEHGHSKKIDIDILKKLFLLSFGVITIFSFKSGDK